MAADAAMAKENQEGPKGITQDMINKLNAGAPAGGGISGLRPNLAATKEKSLDEMIEDRRKLLESQGVKTDYYSKMIEDLRKEKEFMTSEQIRQQVELNKKFNVQQKLNLYNMKDQKLDGSKKNWSNALTIYSTKIQLLEQILEYIDQGAVSINNNFINDTK
jgi:hypothetical protein